MAFGQAALALCGRREWSWLSPAVGLALLTALCWATVRLPGDGVASAIAMLVVTLGCALFLRGRVEGLGEAVRVGAPVALLALAAASLPFIVEGRFGILGTSFNPDMSQHLLAADRLAHGEGGQLLSQGYPLGPHAIVVALGKGLGVGPVQGFGGLTLAVAVLASLTALGALAELPGGRRTLGALLVGLPYLVASYLAQGAFKETMQALFVLGFAIGLWELSRRRAAVDGGNPGALGAVPLAVLAAGSVFAYSFPGLVWLLGAVAIWAALEMLRVRGTPGGAAALVRMGWRLGWPALVVFAVLTAPELGRMLDFREFETFDPGGPGLGNLFGQISPAEALGIWPSGDFRLSPGDGAVPAVGFYAGVALALALLAYGVAWWLRRGEAAIPAALAAAGGVYVAARAGGTPYTAAKAVEMAAPLAALVIVRPMLSFEPAGLRPGSLAAVVKPALAAAFAAGAAGCSLLALGNAPVGPAGYSPALTGLRPELAGSSTLVLAPSDFLADEHGTPYIAWELRGGRVCIEPAVTPAPPSRPNSSPPQGVRFVITWAGSGPQPPFSDLQLQRRAGSYLLWRRPGPLRGPSACPLIAVRVARQGEKQGG
ncbi:MAG: hypothetical protein AABM29_03940 [Actinomycetota bacterium]